MWGTAPAAHRRPSQPPPASRPLLNLAQPLAQSPLPTVLIDVHTQFLEGALQRLVDDPMQRGADEAQRALATLSSLLAAFPGDIQPAFQVPAACGWGVHGRRTTPAA